MGVGGLRASSVCLRWERRVSPSSLRFSGHHPIKSLVETQTLRGKSRTSSLVTPRPPSTGVPWGWTASRRASSGASASRASWVPPSSQTGASTRRRLATASSASRVSRSKSTETAQELRTSRSRFRSLHARYSSRSLLDVLTFSAVDTRE